MDMQRQTAVVGVACPDSVKDLTAMPRPVTVTDVLTSARYHGTETEQAASQFGISTWAKLNEQGRASEDQEPSVRP